MYTGNIASFYNIIIIRMKHLKFLAECILKNVNLTNRYYALYPYDDPVHTKLLSEHAFHNYNNLKPSQVNIPNLNE
jgi:hypothetical protein